MGNLCQKKYSESCSRNKDPILKVLEQELPRHGTVLEIASGTGEHSVYFTENLPPLAWLPTDMDASALNSIRAWWWEAQYRNIMTPIKLDVTEDLWPVDEAPPPLPITSVVCINMTHISPWEATEGLMKGAGRLLPQGEGILYLYGPYRVDGKHTSQSNEDFDGWLKGQDESWGIRDQQEIIDLAQKHELVFDKSVKMPANNFSLIFKRQLYPENE